MSYVSKNPRFTTTSITDSTTGTISSPPSGADKIINRNGVLYLKNSAGGETPIGSSSGGKNYLAKQSDASAAVGTVSVVAAGGNISVSGTFPNVSSAWYADAGLSPIAISPDNTLRGTSNYLTALTSFDAAGAVYVQTPAFNIDGEDLGKALAVQFDVAGNTTANDWDVVAVRYTSAGVFGALIPIAGIASTTTGTASAQVPTGTTTFRGFFITGSTASDVYSIRWRRRAGAVAIRFDNLIVGPNSVMLGTAIQDTKTASAGMSWTNATLGTSPVNVVKFGRAGDLANIYGTLELGTGGSFTGTLGGTIPTEIGTINTSVLNSSAVDYAIGSCWMRNENGASDPEYAGVVVFTTGSGLIQFVPNSTSDSRVNATQPFAWAVGDRLSYAIQIPITGWSSNVTMADRAVEEYVSTSGTWNAASSTTVYGPAGFAMGGALTASQNKTVTFNTVVSATDMITLEVSKDQISWYPFHGTDIGSDNNPPLLVTSTTSGGAISGATIRPGATSSQAIISFAQYRSVATDGSPVTDWPSSLAYWRVRKVSGGAVGFPVGARNVIGDTTGTAVPAGYIGETLTQSRLRGALTSLTTGVPLNVLATPLTLTPGVWSLTGTVAYKTATTTSVTAIFAAINTTSATIPATTSYAVPSSTGQIAVSRETSATVYGSGDNNLILPPQTIVVATSTIYYLVAQGNFTVSTLDVYGIISAVRIA